MGKLVERSPVDGRVIGEYDTPSDEEVREAVARSREAFARWGRAPVSERLAALRGIRRALTDDLGATVRAVTETTGKPELEALAGDLATSLEAVMYYEKHGEALLAPEPRPAFRLAPTAEFHVELSPLGVAAVVSPWNYPLQLSLIPVATALAAGCTVILKPSEVTPRIGALLASACERAGLPEGVFQVLQGGPEVGAALVAARPDKVFFTGSVATGKKIMAAAAEHLVPLSLELGGKDPAIVFADATFERAVAGVVWGAFANAGQICVSVERVYVERSVHDGFVEAVTAAARALVVGAGPDADLGPIIRPEQKAVIDAHVDEALAKGATLTTPRIREEAFYHPLVLRDVDHSMLVMTEETFGPVLPVMAFETEGEAIALANDSAYGLGASVWTRDLAKGRRVASALVAGAVSVNDVVKNIANPHMPFGGEKASGLGRYHGPEGLRAFSRQKAVMVTDGRLRRDPGWFPYDAKGTAAVEALVTALYGARPPLEKARRIAEDLVGRVSGRRTR